MPVTVLLHFFCRLRPIVIDAQNVAVEHAKRNNNPFKFSSRGIGKLY